MGHARDQSAIGSTQAQRIVHLVFPGDELSVRGALHKTIGAIRGLEIAALLEGVVEIVLAEALNNIVEHAYGPERHGVIELEIDRLADALAVKITDDGQPMPNGDLPQGKTHDLDVATADLPEGGFGWSLIHELTQQLAYHHEGGRNTLTFLVSLAAPRLPN